jgi:hypothetical protein
MADSAVDFAGLDTAIDTTDVGLESTETQVETPETGQQDSEGQRVTGVEGQQADGRRGPQNIRNSIKAASEAIPEQAQAFKELGNAYFREQAYKKEFATPQEAASAKQLITDIGGVEGIAELQQRTQTYSQQDAALESGDPAVLDAFFKDFPAGAAALAPHYLDKLAATNPEAMQTAIAPYAIGMLEQAGVAGHLDQILNEPDAARAKALVTQLKEWFQSQRGNVQQIKQNRQSSTNNPESKRLTEQREALNKERDQLFTSQVQERVNSTAGTEVAKAADAYVKQYRLGDEQKQFFIQQLGAKIVEELNQDKAYKQQIDIRKAAKDRNPAAIADFMSQQVRARLPKAALALAKTMYGSSARPAVVAPQNGNGTQVKAPPTGPNGGRIFVSARPDNSQLSTNYEGYQLDWIKGVGVRKSDGAKIAWRK